MSPISSSSIVPPCARSNLPCRSLSAPVKEPFLCPNNSLSSRAAGMAAQLRQQNCHPFGRLCDYLLKAIEIRYGRFRFVVYFFSRTAQRMLNRRQQILRLSGFRT